MRRYLTASIPPTLKLTALALCKYADMRGMCDLHIKVLITITGFSRRKIQRDLAELENLKLLKRQFRTNKSIIYWLNTQPQKLFPNIKAEGGNDVCIPR
jgi:hypothetical protein